MKTKTNKKLFDMFDKEWNVICEITEGDWDGDIPSCYKNIEKIIKELSKRFKDK